MPIGLLLANGVLSLMGALTSDAAFLSWGWRVPFLLSGLLVIVGLWIRLTHRREPAVPGGGGRATTRRPPPIVEVLRRYPKQVLLAIGARVGVDVAFYTFVLFITTYITTYLKLPRSYALNAVLIAAAVQVFAIPFFGHLSDRFARRPVYLVGAIGAAVWVFVFFALLDTGQFVLIVLATVVALIFHAAMYGPQAAFIAEMFPTKVRYTGASMGYQLAGILGGALAPIISVALLDRFDTLGGRVGLRGAMLAVTIVCVLLSPGDLARSTCTPTPTAQPPRPEVAHDDREHRPQQRPRRGVRRLDAWATTRPCSTWSPAPTWPAASTPATPTSCAGSARLAAERGVVIGAQVGYRDLPASAGAPSTSTRPTLTNEVIYQIAALDGFARVAGTRVSYVKPHGALYNPSCTTEAQATAVVEAMQAVRPVAPGAGPARVVGPRRGRRGPGCPPSPRRSPTAATPRRARWCRGRSRGRCCTTRGRSPSGW